MEYAIRKYGDPDIKWSAQGMLRLTQEAMRKLFMPTISKIKEAVDSVTVANKDKGIHIQANSVDVSCYFIGVVIDFDSFTGLNFTDLRRALIFSQQYYLICHNEFNKNGGS